MLVSFLLKCITEEERVQNGGEESFPGPRKAQQYRHCGRKEEDSISECTGTDEWCSALRSSGEKQQKGTSEQQKGKSLQ